jgi:hypothetical protein
VPWRDWQFWIVTVLAVGAVWYLLRNIVPVGRMFGRGKQAKGQSRRATLTISAKDPKPPAS